jgi:hypothetical protein
MYHTYVVKQSIFFNASLMFLCVDICMQKIIFVCEDMYVCKHVHNSMHGYTLCKKLYLCVRICMQTCTQQYAWIHTCVIKHVLDFYFLIKRYI